MSESTIELFRQLSTRSTDLVILHDAGGGAVDVAGDASVLAVASGDRLWDRASDGGDALRAAFARTITDHSTLYVEWRPAAGQASGGWLETRFMCLPALEDASATVISITHAVGDRAREKDPERGLDDQRSIVRRAAFGIYRSTVGGRFLEVNPALARMLGYPSEEELLAIDLGTDLYVDPADRETLVRRARERRLGDWTQVRWKTRDGSIISVRIVVNAVFDSDGELAEFEGIVEDETEKLRRDNILRRSERMASLGTMLAGVAHELNNPLAAIGGFAQIMLRSTQLSDEDRSALETINHEANRAARIVRDLQVFSREKPPEQLEGLDMNEVISYVAASHRFGMESHGISRVLELQPELPRVLAERTPLEQVLINLISNARNALEQIVDAPVSGDTRPESPTIWVRSRSDGGNVIVEVEDNGIGIPPAVLPRIFDPFFTTRDEGQGSGLGLAVVHGIVSEFGGTVEAESEPGSGALLRVTLPAVLSDEESRSDQGAQEAAPGSRTGSQLDILVVDDETAIRGLLKRYFEARGHSVSVAESGLAAIRLIQQAAFDVIISDLRLPGIDGMETLRRIRDIPTGRSSRCIIMTGANIQPPSGPLAEHLRLQAVIEKPFEIEHLRELVELA